MDDYSGFSSDRDGTSSASLCYTSSSDGWDTSGLQDLLPEIPRCFKWIPSGFNLLVGTDGVTQTDPLHGMADACALLSEGATGNAVNIHVLQRRSKQM